MAEEIPKGVYQLDIINTLIDRRVRGEPLGYSVLKLNPVELEFFERISGEARRQGYYDRSQFILKAQREAAKSGVGVASTNTGFISRANFSSVSGGTRYIPQSQAKQSIAAKNAEIQRNAMQSEQNYAFINPNSLSNQTRHAGPINSVGALSITQDEYNAFSSGNTTTSVPLFITGINRSDTFNNAINRGFIEGTVLRETPTATGIFRGVGSRGQFEFNTAQLTRAKDQANLIQEFQTSPKSFVGLGLATSTVKDNTESFTLNAKAFDQFYTKESNLRYATSARNQFDSLSLGQRNNLNFVETYGVAAPRFALGTLDFIGTGVKTLTYNLGVRTDAGKSGSFIQRYEFKTGVEKADNYLYDLRTAPSVQSVNPFFRVPGLGLEVPTNIAGAKEFVQRPEQVLVGLNTGALGYGIARGFSGGYSLYRAERNAGGSRLGSLNVLAGESLTNLGIISTRQRIFTTETGLSPFKTTQINKNAQITSIKIGESGTEDLYSITKAQNVQLTPSRLDYVIFKPGLTKSEFKTGSFDTTQTQIISLRGNTFNLKPTEKDNIFKITGKGQREVLSFKNEVFQSGRYSLDSRFVASKTIQSFNSFGKAKIINRGGSKTLAINIDRSAFKNLERQTFIGSYSAFGKSFRPSGLQEGKAFGKGISGRPSTSKSFGINTQYIKIDSDLGVANFGKSISKFETGGRRGLQLFSTKTLIPKNNVIKLGFKGNLDSGKGLGSGIKVSRIQGKGLVTQLGKQSLIETSAANTLAPVKSASQVNSFTQIGRTKASQSIISLKSPTPISKQMSSQITATSQLNQFKTRFDNLSLTKSVSSSSLSPTQTSAQSSLQSTRQINNLATIGQLVGSPTSELTSQNDFTFRPPRPTGGFGALPDFPSLGGYAAPKGRRKRIKPSSFDIAPSFTSIIADFRTTTPIKVSKTFGVSPGEVRPLFVGPKSKTQRYFTLTDL